MNTTAGVPNCSSLINSKAEKVGETTVCCLILIVSLVGNSSIAIIVYKTKTLRTPINYFIMNMGMSDLLYAIFMFPRYIAEVLMRSWLIGGSLGQVLCKLSYFLPDVSTAVSIQSLVLIAVDRFGAVVFPLRSPLISSKRCLFFILASWIIAMAMTSPYLFAVKLVEYQGQLTCDLRWSEAFGDSSFTANYFLFSYVVILYIPLASLIILYSTILYKLNSRKIPGELTVNAEGQRARRNRNLLKMAISIVVAFVLCWLPLSVIHLLHHFAWDTGIPSCGILLYWSVAWIVATSNCAINPFICFAFSGNYRRGLKRLL